jgi:hypothetical protein
VLSRDLRERGE